ncbi:MAG: class I SAM-dependent methyltransferase [Candidatus Dormibacteria bacterium]
MLQKLRSLTGGIVGKRIPVPPVEMRRLIGVPDKREFLAPTDMEFYPAFKPGAQDSVFDFGSGCGRLARMFMLQEPPPRRYVGVDIHRGMVEWCQRELSSRAAAFEFHHHDVYNIGFNPSAQARELPFPVGDGEFSLAVAWSVFTHLLEPQAGHYLREMRRILHPGGRLMCTWFLFDKADYPMMQEFQNALFINDVDPTNAVIYDRGWLRRSAREAGLSIVAVAPPKARGFQWLLTLAPSADGLVEVELPDDSAPRAAESRLSPPLLPEGADSIGRRLPGG